MLLYDTLFGGRALLAVGGQLLTAVEPILYGALIAYLLAPVVNFFERNLFASAVAKAHKNGLMAAKLPRRASLLLTWLVICVLGYLLASVLLPELYKSSFAAGEQCGELLPHHHRLGGASAGDQSGGGILGHGPDGYLL